METVFKADSGFGVSLHDGLDTAFIVGEVLSKLGGRVGSHEEVDVVDGFFASSVGAGHFELVYGRMLEKVVS